MESKLSMNSRISRSKFSQVVPHPPLKTVLSCLCGPCIRLGPDSRSVRLYSLYCAAAAAAYARRRMLLCGLRGAG